MPDRWDVIQRVIANLRCSELENREYALRARTKRETAFWAGYALGRGSAARQLTAELEANEKHAAPEENPR